MSYNSKYKSSEIEAILDSVEGKQDAISDIDSIRSGASKGATAVQPENIPNEVELIAISGDMLADEPTYTVTEAQAIIDAYNANKLIAIKCGTRINFGKGWFIPNINIRTQSGMSQIFLSGILGNYYIEHRIIYDTSAGTISTAAQSLIDLSESGGSSEGEGSTKEVVRVDGDTIDLLEPNKIYLFSTIRTSLQISEIVYPDGYHAEYCIMSNGAGFGGEGSSISLIFPDNISIYWVGDDISSISNADIWELSIVYTESPVDSCFKCVLTKFT